MRKLNPVNDDAIDFIKKVISSTHKKKGEGLLEKEKTYKERCKTIFDLNEDYVKEYDREFSSDSLENLDGTHPSLTIQEHTDVQNLYGYNKHLITELRNNVLTEDGVRNMFCPLCGVNLVNTMDHFIPQTKYPLFAVHPRNLIPCCTLCNGRKSSQLTENGKRKFWNSYIDVPPKENYLCCNIIDEHGLPKVAFYIEQGKIDDNTFRLIENTMTEKGQKVLQAYKNASGKFIIELRNLVVNYIIKNPQLTFNECITKVESHLDMSFIPNDCGSVVKKALIKSNVFLKCVKQQLTRLNIQYHD